MSAPRTALAIGLGLALAAAAPAAEFRGVIAAIDLKRKELRLDGRGPIRGETLTFRLDDATEVFFAGQPGTLDELTPGRRARITSEPRDGRPVARTIRVFGGRPVEAPAAPPLAARTDGGTAGLTGDVVSGILRRVALTDREIVVVGPGARGPETETTIAVPDGTPVRRGETPIKFEALKEGEPVAVGTRKRDGRLTATAVQAGPGAATVHATPPPKRQPGRALPRVRLLLRIAEQVLREVERQQEQGP